MKCANFTSIICQSFDGGTKQRALQQMTKTPDDIISCVCRTLKLTPSQSCIFAFAISQSTYHNLSQEAIRLMKSKFAEIENSCCGFMPAKFNH